MHTDTNSHYELLCNTHEFYMYAYRCKQLTDTERQFIRNRLAEIEAELFEYEINYT